jgi:CheY-like chemotaxis protein
VAETLRAPHVLVVDDDEDIRTVVCGCLAEEGYAVAAAANGYEALEAVAQHPPDVVLLDMHMPAADGWAFMSGYRQAIATPGRVVVFTAAADAARCAAEVNADAFLAKPFDVDRLVALVEGVLSGDALASVPAD